MENTNIMQELALDLSALDGVLDSLESQINGAIAMDDTKTSCPLWVGRHTLVLVSLKPAVTDGVQIGWNLIFAHTDGQPMPSQFKTGDNRIGHIFVRDLGMFCLNMRFAIRKPTLNDKQTLQELGHPHDIWLVAKSQMKSWGLSWYNQIDYVETQKMH